MTTEENRVVLMRIAKGEENFNSFYSTNRILAAPQLCSESRLVTLKTLYLCFGSQTDDFKTHGLFQLRPRHSLLVGNPSKGPNPAQSHIGVFGMSIKEEERNQIQSLAIDMNTACPKTAYRYVNI
jgi:hypothetical protein